MSKASKAAAAASRYLSPASLYTDDPLEKAFCCVGMLAPVVVVYVAKNVRKDARKLLDSISDRAEEIDALIGNSGLSAGQQSLARTVLSLFVDDDETAEAVPEAPCATPCAGPCSTPCGSSACTPDAAPVAPKEDAVTDYFANAVAAANRKAEIAAKIAALQAEIDALTRTAPVAP